MFNNLTVRARLVGAFLAVAILGAVVAGIGILNINRINKMAEEMYQVDLLGLSYIKEANVNLIYVGRARANFMLSSSAEERNEHLQNIKKYLNAAKDFMAKAEPLFVLPKAKALFSQYPEVWDRYEKSLWKGLDMAAQEQAQAPSAALKEILVETRKHANEMDSLLTSLARIKEGKAEAAAKESAQVYDSSMMLMATLAIAAAIVGIGLGLLITRSLTRELGGEPRYASMVANRIAAGDLTVAVETRENDTTSLLFAIRKMREGLAGIVSQVRSGTDTIATASGQIAAGNMDLSSRTEEQASSLEETAASMEELTSTVKQNADNSRQANQLAQSASDVAIKGGEVVSQVVDTMDEINASSRKIVDIISVIDGIAFQTNILALNAAVEAARAGEQGRGFAVVATEVRSLAQRSASAAKEIKELIGNSVEKVDAGSRLVEQAGTTMQEIVDSIGRVTDIMGEITAASQEQSQGIEQVNQAISQMDQVTQQNAALVEEAAAAADSMQDQAATLLQVVNIFKVDGHAAGALPVASRFAKVEVKAPLHSVSGRAEKKPVFVPQRKLVANGAEEWEEF